MNRRDHISWRTHRSALRPGSLPLVLILLVLLLLAPLLPGAGVRAQDFGPPLPQGARATPLPDHARLLLAELGRPATVTLTDGTVLQGRVGGADGSGFQLQDGAGLMGSRMTVGWASISSVRVQRRNRILEGVFLGGAGGALLGLVSPYGPEGDADILGNEVPRRALRGGSQGVVVGAVLGLLQGLDIHLPLQPVASGLSGPLFPGSRPIRPTSSLVSLYPVNSLALEEIQDSLEAGRPDVLMEEDRDLSVGETWNGRTGSTLALETGWPAPGRWWLRSRLEWTELPTVQLSARPSEGVTGGYTSILSREYTDLRMLVGMVLPIGGVARLPLAEFSVLAGVSRTTLRTKHKMRFWDPHVMISGMRQTVWRPVLTAGIGLSVLRRPTLAVSLRLEGVMGPGFHADALFDPETEDLLVPRRRITPIGLSFGLEFRFPYF
jgi:hypothetical protein